MTSIEKVLHFMLMPTSIFDTISIIPYWIAYKSSVHSRSAGTLSVVRILRLAILVIQMLHRNRRFPKVSLDQGDQICSLRSVCLTP